jgi:hypothetical protein
LKTMARHHSRGPHTHSRHEPHGGGRLDEIQLEGEDMAYVD